MWLGLVALALLGACAREVRQIATPTATRAPAVTLATFTPTLPPTPTVAPTVTATPAPALRRLTEPGCCTQPGWSLDSQQVIFVDQPAPAAPSGYYALDITQPEAPPSLFTERMLIYSPDFQAAAYPQGAMTILERLDTGQRWTLDTDGNPPALSPDKSQVVWEDTADSGPYDKRRTDIWLASLLPDTPPTPEMVLSVHGGGLAAWFPDSRRWLMVARPAPDSEELTLSVFSLDERSRLDLTQAERIRNITLSPEGTWVAYFMSFMADPAQDGVWLMRTDGSQQRKLDVFGSYQWRDDGRLLLVPMDIGAASHQVWQIEAGSGAATPLTQPEVTSFKIAGGDWQVSPDGQHMVFVSARDKAMWLLTFNVP